MQSAAEPSYFHSESLSPTSEEDSDFSLGDETEMEMIRNNFGPILNISKTQRTKVDNTNYSKSMFVAVFMVITSIIILMFMKRAKGLPKVSTPDKNKSLDNAPTPQYETMEELYIIQKDMYTVIRNVNRHLNNMFDESILADELRIALADTISSERAKLVIPSTTESLEEAKEIAYEYIKVYNLAINKPLMKLAIGTVMQITQLSQHFMRSDLADQLFKATENYSITSSPDYKLSIPKVLPDIRRNLKSWYNENPSGEVRTSVELLEKSFVELTQLLNRASKLLDEISPLYRKTVTEIFA